MKRLLICLAVFSLLALPALAQVSPEDPDCVGIDVQGYVDGTASYNAGCVDQFTKTDACVESLELDASGSCTSFDCAAHVPCIDQVVSPCSTNSVNSVQKCGVDVKQDKFDFNASLTYTKADVCSEVQANYAVGANAMTSLGGVAICTTNDPCTLDGAAAVSNAHSLAQNSSLAKDCCVADTAYTGTQNLNLSANYNQ